MSSSKKEPSLLDELAQYSAAAAETIETSKAKDTIRVQIDRQEYGLGSYKPSLYGIVDNYKVVKDIYSLQLSPTIVQLTSHRETQHVSILTPSIFKPSIKTYLLFSQSLSSQILGGHKEAHQKRQAHE